jgi:serine protease inhibitor
MRCSRWGAALCAALVSAAAAGGCAGGPPAAGRPGGAVVLAAREVAVLRSFGAGDTRFGLRVLSALCRQPRTNVVISPVSLAAGLGMAYLGARGATAAAMARVLQLPAAGPGLVAGLRARRRALLASLNRPGVTFAESNRLWADPSLITRRSSRADLSAISPQAWRLGFVQHAATLTVDEKGAVASAATAVGIQATALLIPIIFDRPYLLIITDILTGEPPITAWVANPATG